ncbi:DUF5067 domain-containing protein [Salinicoccus hispanicus]|uniref:DUF5067 domain-containing protein n=1 Tax=Salinicoccus hispanicus TaxID=157225 RepID=A0A6N8TXT3_9STAP|nr:DUF5067 domain-containing protein [Salinicoccus hispanicus]MXQ50550.1 DUF5067 domain-containing protein [Salinicoccus hispanicus]
MSLRKYLLAGGLSSALLLGACNGNGDSEEESTDEETTEEETVEGESTEEETTEEESTDGSTESDEVAFSGEYGDYSITEFGQYTMEPEASEEEEETEEGAEEAGPTELVTIEFEFTNNSDVATSPQEAFGLDLAVRQIMEGGETTLENLTMDLPEDFEKSEEAAASSERIDSGETVTALVAYGPVDTELETVLQSRENPMAEEEIEPLDHTIEMSGSESTEEETTEEETTEDSEE